MGVEEYISKVVEQFGKKGEKAQLIQIENMDTLLIYEKYVDRLGEAMHCIYLHVPDRTSEVDIKYVKDFCDNARVFTDQFFPSNRFWRTLIASTVPIIISEFGFSNITKLYVKNTKFAKYGEISTPILVDLKQKEIITLERFGLFGKGLFKNITYYFREQLCLDDRV